ncbi:hypothetical protein H6F94_06310 [Leptolyngbya sp. FACHB-261]|nr:hypothetical protein [Leptolyngbya sp. FACHB-261]
MQKPINSSTLQFGPRAEASEQPKLLPTHRSIAVYQESIQAEFLTLQAETDSLLRKLQSLSRSAART